MPEHAAFVDHAHGEEFHIRCAGCNADLGLFAAIRRSDESAEDVVDRVLEDAASGTVCPEPLPEQLE
jgi:hypothetical protein